MHLKRILVDMDEVLCDFVSGAAEIHGWTRDELFAVWPPGVWSMQSAMKLSEEDFWKPITANDKYFWESLKPLPWAHQLVADINEICDDWHVVTSPSLSDSSYTGKVKWLKNFFGPRFTRFCITPHKYLFAQPGVLLIDDNESNVNNFIYHGGDGLVFPRRNNLLHKITDPVAHIREMFKGGSHASDLRKR
jgi:5'(3')-deoxyribonucleotidase